MSTLAQHPSAVSAFLEALLAEVQPVAAGQMAALQRIRSQQGHASAGAPAQAWDLPYYLNLAMVICPKCDVVLELQQHMCLRASRSLYLATGPSSMIEGDTAGVQGQALADEHISSLSNYLHLQSCIEGFNFLCQQLFGVSCRAVRLEAGALRAAAAQCSSSVQPGSMAGGQAVGQAGSLTKADCCRRGMGGRCAEAGAD